MTEHVGDRRSRSDRADVGGRVGVGGGRRCQIVERCASQDLGGSRAGGLHPRTIEVLDQRGIADRFLSHFPTRHYYGLGLWQNRIEHTVADWFGELEMPIYRGREVTGIAQDDTGVAAELSDGQSLRAEYLVGCDGGRSLIARQRLVVACPA